MAFKEPQSRSALRSARRVLVKAGTSIVANKDGRPSLTRLGAIVEQISELSRSGVDVIFVSSGAVGMGKRLLRKQGRMNMSFMELQLSHEQKDDSGEGQRLLINGESGNGLGNRTKSFASFLNKDEGPRTLGDKKKTYDSACAAAGQVCLRYEFFIGFYLHIQLIFIIQLITIILFFRLFDFIKL